MMMPRRGRKAWAGARWAILTSIRHGDRGDELLPVYSAPQYSWAGHLIGIGATARDGSQPGIAGSGQLGGPCFGLGLVPGRFPFRFLALRYARLHLLRSSLGVAARQAGAARNYERVNGRTTTRCIHARAAACPECCLDAVVPPLGRH
jgi:hypothetical protein